jgi:hypothetical protein
LTLLLTLISAVGLNRDRDRREGLLYYISLLFGAAWSIGSFSPEISRYVISTSRVIEMRPGPIIQMLMLLPLIAGMFGLPRMIEQAGRNLPRQETLIDRVLKTALDYVKLKSGVERAPLSDVGAMVGYIIKNTTPPENLDLEFCIDVKHKRPVILEGVYRYRNTLVVGPPGSGKTVTLKSHIFQDLNRIKDSLRAGRPMGLTVLEPKGDLVDEVAARCQELGIPFHYINPLSPFTAHFNPMMGPADICAESTRTVLKNIFGKQEAFFSINQELAARNTILLLKRLKGDDLDMLDVLKCLRDYEEMDRTVTGVETKCGEDDLTEFFRKELMGKNRDKYREFIIGLRVQLEDLCGSDLLRKILLGKNSIDLDKHLSEGGVLLVNTAMGRLGKLGDTLGKFFSMHLMNAVFRRPGTESDRPPHFLYVDEFPRYMNEGFEVLLNISRSYCCATTLAIQGFSQMEFSMNEAFRKVVLNSCQNKIFFGGMDHADAKLAEAEMGFRMTEVKEPTYDYRPLIPRIFPQRYSVREKKEPRYEYTQLMELPPHTFVYRIVQFGNLQEPSIGKSRYIKSETVFNPKPDTVPLTAGEPGRFF